MDQPDKKQEEEFPTKTFALVIVFIAYFFGSIQWMTMEESRYIEKRDLWFKDRINSALLYEMAKLDGAVDDLTIPVKSTTSWSFSGEICALVDGKVMRTIKQKELNDFFDRISK